MTGRATTLAKKMEAARPLSAAERLLDDLIGVAAKSLRRTEEALKAGRRTLASMRRDLERELAAKFAEGSTPARREHMEQAISTLAEIQTGGIRRYHRETEAAAEAIARETVAGFGAALEAGTGSDFARRVTAPQLREVMRKDILGERASEWFELEAFNSSRKIGQELRKAYALGESFEDIRFRLGKHTQNVGRETEALARTVVQGWSNEAAHSLYDDNRDILDGKQWIATLDDRTCPQCGPLDGEVWYYGKRSPSIDRMPRAPAHPNCRCFVAPLVAGLSKPDIPTWEQWLARQSPEKQAEAIGKTRAELWRNGEITTSQMRDRNGGIRPVADLERMAKRGR